GVVGSCECVNHPACHPCDDSAGAWRALAVGLYAVNIKRATCSAGGRRGGGPENRRAGRMEDWRGGGRRWRRGTTPRSLRGTAEEAVGGTAGGLGNRLGRERRGGLQCLAGSGDEFAVAQEDVFHAVEVAVLVFNEGLELRLIKGAAAAATEDDGLVAALIDDAVAIEAAADGERGAAGLVGGDQLGRGGRAE